jgi:hypothetical protein
VLDSRARLRGVVVVVIVVAAAAVVVVVIVVIAAAAAAASSSKHHHHHQHQHHHHHHQQQQQQHLREGAVHEPCAHSVGGNNMVKISACAFLHVGSLITSEPFIRGHCKLTEQTNALIFCKCRI